MVILEPLSFSCPAVQGDIVLSINTEYNKILIRDDLSLTFHLDSVRMFSTLIFETYFSYGKDIWVAVTDYYLHQGAIIFMTA